MGIARPRVFQMNFFNGFIVLYTKCKTKVDYMCTVLFKTGNDRDSCQNEKHAMLRSNMGIHGYGSLGDLDRKKQESPQKQTHMTVRDRERDNT